MKEQKILEKFCRKLVAMDMDIFGLRGMAKDADPDKKSDWITMNGTHIKVGEGETPQEAGKKFAAKKESERASSSPKTGKSGSAKSNLTPASEEKRQKLIQYYDNIIKSGIDSPERNEITRQQIEMLKNARTENDITKAVQWPNYADNSDYDEYSGLSEKEFYDLENQTSAGTEQTVEQKIAGNFWTRKDEMKNDLEERGFTVHEINDEYADIEDANGKPYVVRLGKANNTIYPESISPADNDDNDWVHPDTYGAANPGRNDEDNWTHEDPWKDNGIMENSNERRKLHNEGEKQPRQQENPQASSTKKVRGW